MELPQFVDDESINSLDQFIENQVANDSNADECYSVAEIIDMCNEPKTTKRLDMLTESEMKDVVGMLEDNKVEEIIDLLEEKGVA